MSNAHLSRRCVPGVYEVRDLLPGGTCIREREEGKGRVFVAVLECYERVSLALV